MSERKDLMLSGGELGKSLIQSARAAVRKALTDQCVAEVQGIMEVINHSETLIKYEQLRIQIMEARLEAIEDGKIQIFRPVNGAMQIRYDDEKLNPVRVRQMIGQDLSGAFD